MKAKITAKILIALCCIINVMPFSNVEASNNQSLTVNITLSDSEVTYRDDPQDSRYEIGTVYLSFNSSVACAGIATVYFGTTNNYAAGNISLPYAFSPNGVNVASIEEFGVGDHTPEVYGFEVTLDWQNLDQWLVVFEYRVLKTANHSTYGPLDLIYGGIDIEPEQLLPSYPGMINAELEYLNGNIDLLILNENLSDQDIEAMLGQIAGNTYNMEQLLDSIYLDAVNPTTVSTWGMGYYKELTANATYYNTAGYINGNNGKIYLDLTTNRVADWNGYFLVNHFYRLFLRTGNQGSDIDIVQNFKFNGIWIFNRTTGEKHFYDTSYYKYYLINSSGTTTLYLWDIYIPFNSNYKMILEFTGSTNNNTIIFNSTGSTVSDWTYTYNEYYEMTYRFSVLNGIERIIGAIGDISVEQTINIDNTYNELNTYNTQINTITNNYNTQFTDLNQQLEFDDLLDVDPESENNILNSVNFYNSVFNEFIEVPHVKEILIFILLCILIIGLVG